MKKPGADNSQKTRPDDRISVTVDSTNSETTKELFVAPTRIDRYRIDRLLGQGGFGLVLLGFDEELERQVAIKVPHAKMAYRADAYLAEARAVAGMDHPHIVPVYDIGQTPEYPCYIVFKYVEGQTLRERQRESRFAYKEAAELVITISDALHYAHQCGLVHRDIKPSNILINKHDEPFIADFGLALKETDDRQQTSYAGTPAYMSPEQARGEGHRVDGRSDIYSLGSVFYELLVDCRTFASFSTSELMEKIANSEPKPLRQIDENVPKELERICLKALAHRASDRYAMAADMAEDLRRFLADHAGAVLEKTASAQTIDPATRPATDVSSGTPTIDSSMQSVHIVPKGLRSFDEHDADFFLALIPGARDRDGLPDGIRFWKSRIEETDADKTFPVGLLYGPSGCGKSSLVKAGLLPRLADHVTTIFIEATPDDTETRLLHRLSKQRPDLPEGLSLTEALQFIRKSDENGKKLLIVLDQFEQWLYAKREFESSGLLQALRQCDGGNVQCILMVRDDFWMAITRFMRDLEIRLVEGHNSAPVDLFSLKHAQKVLGAFGRAFDVLPNSYAKMTVDQKRFVEESVDGLAQDGRVICVRLALFAEMMKTQPWTPTSLRRVGGTEGVAVAFLDDTFAASTAAPEHRRHQKAARSVLKVLLPDAHLEIKGRMRSRDELSEASGYAKRPGDFEALISILDTELRLITPIDPDSAEDTNTNIDVDERENYYQLTHDYLVPSLRIWINQKQKETRRGRAELKLAERAALWNNKPEARHLPSSWEYLNILALTQKRTWSTSQEAMMRKAGRAHFYRATIFAVFLGLFGISAYQIHGKFTSGALIDRLKDAKEDAVLEIADQLGRYQKWARPELEKLSRSQARTAVERRHQLHARVVLLQTDESHLQEVKKALLHASPSSIGYLRDALLPYKTKVAPELWTELRNESVQNDRRFRAGVALASYATDSEEWKQQDLNYLSNELVESNPEHQPIFRNHLEPISHRLAPILVRLFRQPRISENRQLATANALNQFTSHDPVGIAKLLSDATPIQHEVLFPTFLEIHDQAAMEWLKNQTKQEPADNMIAWQRIGLGRSRASAAIALLHLDRPRDVFAALRVREDPESLTQFVHGCRSRGVTADQLIKCLRMADDSRKSKVAVELAAENRVLYGLLSCLGEFKFSDIPAPHKQDLVDSLAQWYKDDPSSVIHGVTGWLLRRWAKNDIAAKIENRAVPYSPDREWFTVEVDISGGVASSSNPKPPDQEQASKTNFFLTFVVFPTGKFNMGSPENEPGRGKDELQHEVTISNDFAILDREITFGELCALLPEHTEFMNKGFSPPHPAVAMNWVAANRFCKLLNEKMGWLPGGETSSGPQVRLPTEAEWEFACRGGTTTAFGFGNDGDLLVHYGRARQMGKLRAIVGREFRPNLRGVFDMHGSVHEWCNDMYRGYDGKAIESINPKSFRVHRGGNWRDGLAFNFRSANRDFRRATVYSSGVLGFRIAIDHVDKLERK